MDNRPGNWAEMTPEEKRAWRLEFYRNSGKNVKFISKEAEKNYNTRVNRQIAVYNVEKPDRIPCNFSAGNLPLQMAGLENRTAYYEPEKAYEAAMKFNEKYAAELESFPADVILRRGHGNPRLQAVCMAGRAALTPAASSSGRASI